MTERARKVFEETLRTLQKNPDAVRRSMSRPDLFETHAEKVRAELANCIRAAREGRQMAAANARAVAQAIRNAPPGSFLPPFGLGPGFPFLRGPPPPFMGAGGPMLNSRGPPVFPNPHVSFRN